MKHFVIGFFVGGALFGGAIAYYYSEFREIQVQNVRIPDEIVYGSDMEFHSYGTEISIRGWTLFLMEGKETELASIVSDSASRPMATFERRNDGSGRIGGTDSNEQLFYAIHDKDGNFQSQRILVEKDDGNRFTFMDDGFNGFFSRSIQFPGGDILWGNLSDETWLPLRKAEGQLMAKEDDVWVPVEWEDGRLIFSEANFREESDGDNNAQD